MTYSSAPRYPDPPPHRPWRRPLLAALLALGGAWPRPAAAIQPLKAFLGEVPGHNYELLQSAAADAQRAQEARAATGKLLPMLNLGGTYTRNQYNAVLPYGTRMLTLAPYDQFDASATLTVPVIDVGNWARRSVAGHTAHAAAQQRASTHLESAKQVAQQYYGLRGSEGMLEAAKGSQAFAERNLGLVRARREVGTASTLEVARAESDAADAAQQVASAELQVVLARRNLQTLTGLLAEPAGSLPEVALDDELPLAQWLQRVDGALPAVAAAEAQAQAARAGDRAAKYGYVPTLNLTASERVTNASALNGGHTFVFTAKANLSWQLDATLTPTQKAQAFAARSARVRADQVRRQLADAVYSDFAQIRANQATSRAARAQVRATKLAETLALEKAAAGVMTQLDVTQARRDAFAAEVHRIQADANLLYYRTLLRLDSAREVADFEELSP